MLTDAKREFIEFMMSCDVLRFGDFVTKSGRRTPYFVNTGLYRTGAQIAKLGDFYAARVNEVCGDGFDAMFGLQGHSVGDDHFCVPGAQLRPG